jgi:methylated-DNA-[protein]-cysteine S-methyltransferase
MNSLKNALGDPLPENLSRSRGGLKEWFAGAALLIRWDAVETPIGLIYLALSDVGLCRLDFNQPEASFLARLDPLARAERDPRALGRIEAQLAEYFSGKRRVFDVPVDWRQVKPFQRNVLEAALRIPPGSWQTYHEIASAIGQPKASRAVGQALARNPVAIIVPCHRVLASDGGLGGYAGGLDRKRTLLQMEGATW